MSRELHELTGVYALDALSGQEQALFEEHLEGCEACRREVTELQAATLSLAEAKEEEPPAGLRDRVLAQLDQTPQDPPGSRAVDPEITPPGSALGDRSAMPDSLPAPKSPDEPQFTAPPEATEDPQFTAPPEPTDELSARRSEGAVARQDELADRRAHPWWGGVLAPAAAIVLILGVGVSLLIAELYDRIAELQTESERMEQVLTAPDAGTVATQGPDGSIARLVMSPSQGGAVFLAHGMAPAPDEHTYEMWLIHDDAFVSVGQFDVDETGGVLHAVTGEMEQVQAIGVTVEPEGGSPEPTTDPVMLLEFEDA